MQKLRYLLYLLSAVLIMGCGQTVVETLHVTDSSHANGPGKGQTIIILPFADYTSTDSIAGAYRRNLTVTEALTDRLVSNGFGIAVQEDVFGHLVDEKIISIASYDGNNSESLQLEMENEWSDVMKNHLQGYIQLQKNQVDKTISASPGTHAVDKNALAKLGRKFNADYVVRGRILEYRTRNEATWAPWKRGILPVVTGGSSRILNGFASSDTYDERNEALGGALLGGFFAHNNATWPWDKDQALLGLVDGTANSILWAGVGSAVGMVSNSSGKVDQAAVQMRVWVQEAATGNVVWTNRIRVLVSPETIFSDKQYDTLFNRAIEKGVETLIDHFVTYGL